MCDSYSLRNGFIMEGEEDVELLQKLLALQPHYNINYRWNDIGLSDLFSECFSKQERFCLDNLKWYVYENGQWKLDKGDVKSHANMQKLLCMLPLYCDEIETDSNKEILDKYRTYINKCSSDTNIKKALNSARKALSIEITDFDANPYLLKCKNGVYDMEKLSFRQAQPGDYLTLSTNCNYIIPLSPFKQTRCDRWYTFVDEIMDGDKEKANFLQKALGYSMLGVNKEECMFLAYGAKSRNGKGTLFNTIKKVLGTYGGTINSALVCESKYKDKDYNAPEPMLADTVGIRYMTLSETKDKATLDVNAIKSLTGQDPRKTRQLNCPAFTFTPQFTMWLSTNFLPMVKDDTIFRSDRIWVIEFNHYFDKASRDDSLKLLFEHPDNQPTILQWLIDGYCKYVEEGLNPPQCVIDATERYARSNNRILLFKEDCLEDAPGERLSRAAAYAKYKSWCADDERNFTPLGTTSFYNELGRYYHRKDSNGFRGFEDVKIKMPENVITIK